MSRINAESHVSAGKSDIAINPKTGRPNIVDELYRSPKDYRDAAQNVGEVGKAATELVLEAEHIHAGYTLYHIFKQ